MFGRSSENQKKKIIKGKRRSINEFEEKAPPKKPNTNFFNDPEKEIEFDYILANSDYFKANPKQLTSKCNFGKYLAPLCMETATKSNLQPDYQAL